jgi:hypothetical protein
MKKILLPIQKAILRIYFSIRTTPFVWRMLNREGISLLEKSNPALSQEQTRLIEELKKNGIAVTTLDTLFPGKNMLQTLVSYSKTLNSDEAEQGKKKFLRKYWDRYPLFDLKNPFVKMTLDTTVVDVINGYMNMYTKLKYYDLALTIPMPAGSEAVQSQRWHRDPEEKKICKIFVYLNDVDETTGPFTYVYQSNHDGKWGHLFPQKPPEGVYPADGAVEKAIPAEDIKVMTGKAGTVIFCDTSGIHKGGYATGKERLMFTGFFAAQSYSEKPYYSFPEGFDVERSQLSTPAKYAITQ